MELLTERDRYSVLQVRTTHFEDIFVLFAFRTERICKSAERFHQQIRFMYGAYLDRCRAGVVRGLCHIGMVVRRNDSIIAFFLTDHLERTVRKKLVHIHIERSARTALDRIDGEMLMQLACDHFIGCRAKCLADLRIETARRHVGSGCRFFDLRERYDKIRICALFRDLEVLHRTHRLYTVIRFVRYCYITQKIMFNSHVIILPLLLF